MMTRVSIPTPKNSQESSTVQAAPQAPARAERQLLNLLTETNSPSSFIRFHPFFVLIQHKVYNLLPTRPRARNARQAARLITQP